MTSNAPDYEAALQLNAFREQEEAKVRANYLDWDRRVFNPVATQAFRHLNRRPEKRVCFNLDTAPFRLVVDASKDPAKRQLLQNHCERRFEKECGAFFSSAPIPPDPLEERRALGAEALPKSISRAILEPDIWGQYSTSVFGHFIETCDPRGTARRMKIGGPNVHIPDETDYNAAGTRVSRLHGFGDKGVLRDNVARGETYELRDGSGGGSAAPAQDHFAFKSGREIVDLEFPPPKRTFPELQMH